MYDGHDEYGLRDQNRLTLSPSPVTENRIQSLLGVNNYSLKALE